MFRNYSSRLARVLSTIRAGRARTIEEMFTRKLTKNSEYLEILLSYLNNPFKRGNPFKGSKRGTRNVTK